MFGWKLPTDSWMITVVYTGWAPHGCPPLSAKTSRVTDTWNNSVRCFLLAGLIVKQTRLNITDGNYIAIIFPPCRWTSRCIPRKNKTKTRSNIELTHRVKAANEEYGVRFVPPAWVLLRVQRVHCLKSCPRKSSCAIRNLRDKISICFLTALETGLHFNLLKSGGWTSNSSPPLIGSARK